MRIRGQHHWRSVTVRVARRPVVRGALTGLEGVLDPLIAERVEGRIEERARVGGRTTRARLREALGRRFAETPGLAWLGEKDGPNPYAGLLAWADRIVCSPDSVNMVSEACATRVPVFVFDPQRAHGRVRMFLDSLLQRGRIRAMDAVLASFEVEPLRETARVAEEVRARLAP